jgi:hypothetical protein
LAHFKEGRIINTTGLARRRSDALILSRPPALVKAAAPVADAAAVSGPSVAVVAVTGAVNAETSAVTAVTWGCDPALDVTGSAGRESRDRRGRLSLSQSPGRLSEPSPARHTEVARSRNARLRDRSCDRSARHVSPAFSSRYMMHCCRSCRWSRSLTRPRGRVFVPKCPKVEKAPHLGWCSKSPVAEARAWVGIGLWQTRRRGGGRSSGALARLVVMAAGGR